MKKVDFFPELIKLGYSVLISMIFVLLFVFVLDGICYLVSGGWINPEDQRHIGNWPIVSGTIRSVIYSPASHVIGIIFGFGMMARMMIGKDTPLLLSFLNASTETENDFH